jgi:hypothetical protein
MKLQLKSAVPAAAAHGMSLMRLSAFAAIQAILQIHHYVIVIETNFGKGEAIPASGYLRKPCASSHGRKRRLRCRAPANTVVPGAGFGDEAGQAE